MSIHNKTTESWKWQQDKKKPIDVGGCDDFFFLKILFKHLRFCCHFIWWKDLWSMCGDGNFRPHYTQPEDYPFAVSVVFDTPVKTKGSLSPMPLWALTDVEVREFRVFILGWMLNVSKSWAPACQAPPRQSRFGAGPRWGPGLKRRKDFLLPVPTSFFVLGLMHFPHICPFFESPTWVYIQKDLNLLHPTVKQWKTSMDHLNLLPSMCDPAP